MYFKAKWTNDMETRGTTIRAMWHQKNEHLAHGKPSVIMHEISGGISSMGNTWQGDFHVSR